MKVEHSTLVKVFEALGIPASLSRNWDTGKLSKKIAKLPTLKEPDAEYPDAGTRDVYDALVKAVNKNEEIEIEGFTDPAERKTKAGKTAAEPPAAKGEKTDGKAKKGGKKPQAKNPGKTSKSGNGVARGKGTWYAKYLKNPAALPAAGVIRFIYDTLLAAGAAKPKPRPLTKEQVHEKVKAEFADRDPAKLATTVNNQIPSRLWYVWGVKITRVTGVDGAKSGYYIAAEDAVDAPAKTKPAAGKKAVPSANGDGKAKKGGKKAAAGKKGGGKKKTAAAA